MTHEATIIKKDGTTETVTVEDKIHNFHCDRCGLDKSHTSSLTTGYGTTQDGEIHCFDCCALDDIDQMKETGEIVLYLTMKDDQLPGETTGKTYGYMTPETLTNWPGSLKFKILSWSRGRHNWGLPRFDLWFKGPDNKIWYGRFIGKWTQLTYCRRTKHTGYAGAVANHYGLS